MAHFITGVVDEILTPFNEDRTINFDMLKEMVEWHISVGIENFFVNGFGGECQQLSTEEKMQVMEAVYSVSKGRAKIMGCAFDNTVDMNKHLIDLYEELGMCDCYCITAPPFFKHTQKAIYDYAAELIDYCKKPVYIYNCAQMGTLFAPDTLARLKKEHLNLRGFKDASVDILNFLQCTLRIDPNDFDFLGGCDGLDGVMMMLGAVGCVSFMAVPFPREMMDIVNAGLEGDFAKCIAAQHKVLKIRNLCKQAPFNAAWIYAMKYGGGPVGMHSRMPADQDYVPDKLKKQLDDLAREIGYDVE